MRPLRYSINLHRYWAEKLAQADALLFGRVTYEMMEAAWRPPATGVRPDWMEPFARTINAFFGATLEVVRMVQQGDVVMAELIGTAKRAAGGEMRMSMAELFVMRDGKSLSAAPG